MGQAIVVFINSGPCTQVWLRGVCYVDVNFRNLVLYSLCTGKGIQL